MNADVLDPSWIANLLSISFTLVVFLLGLPLVFIQTFVPEELREYYKELQMNDRKQVRLTAILLLIVILVFGNHGVKYLLQTGIPESYQFSAWKDFQVTIARNHVIDFYYFLSLSFFIYLSYTIYKNFHNGIFSSANYKKDILRLVFDRIKKNVLDNISRDQTPYLSNKDTLELIELGEIFGSGMDRIDYDQHIFSLTLFIINDPSYSGDGVKVIFEEIYYPHYVRGSVKANYKSVIQMLDVCKAVGDRYANKQGLQSYDSEIISEIFLSELCIKFISDGNINLANSCLRILRLFETQQAVYFYIFYAAFHHQQYQLVMMEIKEITEKVVDDSLIPGDKEPILYNLIAYLSFFNAGNNEMKSFAFRSAKKISAHINLTLCLDAKRNFLRNGKFETAGKISEAIKQFYGLERPHLSE